MFPSGEKAQSQIFGLSIARNEIIPLEGLVVARVWLGR